MALEESTETASEMFYDQIASGEISFEISAPGKVILHGDHSVVYGRLALATSLGLRTRLRLSESYDTREFYLKLNLKTFNLKLAVPIKDVLSHVLNNFLPLIKSAPVYSFEHPEYISHDALLERIELYVDQQHAGALGGDSKPRIALITFLYLYCTIMWPSGVILHSLDIEIDSEITVASGMGSSAAYCCCIVAAFIEYIKTKYQMDNAVIVDSFKTLSVTDLKAFSSAELKMISMWAHQAERIFHGNPSGIDNAVCTYGSMVEYRKGNDPCPMRLNVRLTGLLINTKIPRNTRALVQKVAHLRNRLPSIIDNTLDSMEIITHMAVDCLHKLSDLAATYRDDTKANEYVTQYDLLGDLVDVNQNLLRTLGVSHKSIDSICEILASFGLHGKLTGAGGGGYVLSLIPFYFEQEELTRVQATLEGEQFECRVLELGGSGVSVH